MHRPIGVPDRNLADARIGLVKNQLHVGIVGQRFLVNGPVRFIDLTRNAHVAQKRHVAFADKFDDIA